MKLLSSLSTQDKIKLAAELDGYYVDTGSMLYDGAVIPWTIYTSKDGARFNSTDSRFQYAVSYDAIIPLLQRQYPLLSEDMKSLFFQRIMSTQDCTGVDFMMASPAKLLDALLIVTWRAVL